MSNNTSGDLFQKDHGISEESDLPLYFQIMTLIKHHIHSGALKPGDMIPSESQLCEMYGVSRTTVRQALEQLAEENLIIRRRGKGSFVASQKLNRTLNHLYSFSEDMKAVGLEPHSKVLESTPEEATKEVASALSIPPLSQVFKLTRIRYAGQEPLLLENTYVPLHLCPDIHTRDFGSISLYDTLRLDYQLSMYRAVESYEAVKLTREIARVLHCKPSDPAFSITRIAYLESNVPFELTHSYARSDKCLFKVELKTQKNQVQFTREFNL